MSRLLETIRIVNGRVQNIKYHNLRCNKSRKIIFGASDSIDLRKHIVIPTSYKSGLVKCRIIYDEIVRKVEFESYNIKEIKSLKIVHEDSINYDQKFEDRAQLKSLYNKRQSCDDIIIVRNGYLTDSYYCNLALLKNGIWYTPQKPLLNGTRRAKLLDQGRIKTKKIKHSDLASYEAISLFNSMIPFKTKRLDISQIHI